MNIFTIKNILVRLKIIIFIFIISFLLICCVVLLNLPSDASDLHIRREHIEYVHFNENNEVIINRLNYTGCL